MSHEHILVSALYYYSTSPHLYDEGLDFRVDVNGMGLYNVEKKN